MPLMIWKAPTRISIVPAKLTPATAVPDGRSSYCITRLLSGMRVHSPDPGPVLRSHAVRPLPIRARGAHRRRRAPCPASPGRDEAASGREGPGAGTTTGGRSAPDRARHTHGVMASGTPSRIIAADGRAGTLAGGG